jgi:hypothetical protein
MGLLGRIVNRIRGGSSTNTSPTSSSSSASSSNRPSSPSQSSSGGGMSIAPSRQTGGTSTFTGPGRTVNPFVGGSTGQSTQTNVTPSATITNRGGGGGGGGSFVTDKGQVVGGQLGVAMAQAKPSQGMSIAPTTPSNVLAKSIELRGTKIGQGVVAKNTSRSASSIFNEAKLYAKSGDYFEAGKTLVTGFSDRLKVTNPMYIPYGGPTTGKLVQESFGVLADYSDKATQKLGEYAEAIEVRGANAMNPERGATTEKQKDAIIDKLKTQYETVSVSFEKEVEKFKAKYGNKELSESEYKQAVREQKQLLRQEEVRDSLYRDLVSVVTKLKGPEAKGDLSLRDYARIGVSRGLVTLPTGIVSGVARTIEDPNKMVLNIIPDTIAGLSTFTDKEVPLYKKVQSGAELGTQLLAPEVGSQLIAAKFLKAKAPVKKSYKPQTSVSVELGDTLTINNKFKTDSKVFVEVKNPKTGKVVSKYTTDVQTLGKLINKDGITTADFESVFGTMKSGGTRTFKDANGNIVKVTTSTKTGRARGRAVIQQVDDKISVGGSTSNIVETGVEKAKAFGTREGAKIDITRKGTKTPTQSSSLSGMINKELGRQIEQRAVGNIDFVGETIYSSGQSLTYTYPKTVRVKGYLRNANKEGALFAKRTPTYVRRARNPKKISAVNRGYGINKAFKPDKPVVDLGGFQIIDDGRPRANMPPKDVGNDVSGGLKTVAQQNEVSAAIAREQAASISEFITKSIPKRRLPSGPTKGLKAVKQKANLLKSASKLTLASVVVSGFGSALNERNRERGGFFTSFGLDSGSKNRFGNKDVNITDFRMAAGNLPDQINNQTPASQQGTSQVSITQPLLITPTIPAVVPTTPQPRIKMPDPLRPEEIKFINLPDGQRKNKKKGFIQAYDAQIYVDATKGQKARWVTVADNVQRITALSAGSRFVDDTASNKFRIVKQKGIASRLVDTTWNVLQKKFREYSSKGGVKVSSKPVYIENRMYRIDTQGEKKSIPGVSIARRFGRL